MRLPCPKTLWSMRNSVIVENDLHDCLFEKISDKLSHVFNVDTDKQRIDSVHIKFNIQGVGLRQK